MMGLSEHLLSGEFLIADGATGTMLMAAGLPPGTPPELWNAEQPAQIVRLHRSYVDAGSELILTNTFGGNRTKLSKAGLDGRALELNRAGAALAREAAGDGAYVAGDIGPTGDLMAPLGALTHEDAVAVFAEQASTLTKGGVDLIWIESMMALEEARAAIMGARSATKLPILCSLAFGTGGRTIMGLEASKAAAELWPLGLTAIGANCGQGPDTTGDVLRQMSDALPGVPLIAKPNAGLPRTVDTQVVYDMAPSDFAERMFKLISLGARIVGSCCGSTPAHISALSDLRRRDDPYAHKT